MYSQSEIDEAVAAGALAPEQAGSLRAFVAARNGTPTTDEEYYGLYRGFNDWYVFYTVLLVLIAVGWLGALIPVGSGGRAMGPVGAPIAAPLFVTAASWGLAELFTRWRRTALASVLLTFTFGFGVLFTLVFILAPVVDGSGPTNSVVAAMCCFAASAASFGYWLRFRQPAGQLVFVGLAVLGLLGLFGGLIGASRPGLDVINVVAVLTGIATFAYAMWWDSSDPWRVSERNENGLWLHGLASVLLIFPLVYFVGLYRGIGSVAGALVFLLIFALFAFLALAVNRKIYLLSAVSPLLVALNILIPSERGSAYPYASGYGAYPGAGSYPGPSSYGSAMSYGSNPFMPFGGTVATLLIVSFLLLALAVWWTPLRRAVCAILPEGIRARAPVVDAAPRADVPPPPPVAPPPQPPMT